LVTFEIRVNGERRFLGDSVTAITLVADFLPRRRADRVTVHVGKGGEGEREVQYLGSDLQAGDEISIRVLADDEAASGEAPKGCSFCGKDLSDVTSLVSGGEVAICESCLEAFDAVVTRGASLPLGASIHQEAGDRCGFCLKGPPEVAGLLVRNAAALCPECLHACIDITRPTG